MDRFQTFSVFSPRRTGGIGCGEYLSTAQGISLVINVGTHHAVYGEPYPSAKANRLPRSPARANVHDVERDICPENTRYPRNIGHIKFQSQAQDVFGICG